MVLTVMALINMVMTKTDMMSMDMTNKVMI